MAQIISRYAVRSAERRGPKLLPWVGWSSLGTELSQADCEMLLREWGAVPYSRDALGKPYTYRSRDMAGVDEYRIVADNFDVASYNIALQE